MGCLSKGGGLRCTCSSFGKALCRVLKNHCVDPTSYSKRSSRHKCACCPARNPVHETNELELFLDRGNLLQISCKQNVCLKYVVLIWVPKMWFTRCFRKRHVQREVCVYLLCGLFILLNGSLSKRAAGRGGWERGWGLETTGQTGSSAITRCRAQGSSFTSPSLHFRVYKRKSKAISIRKSAILREHLFYIIKASFNKNLN